MPVWGFPYKHKSTQLTPLPGDGAAPAARRSPRARKVPVHFEAHRRELIIGKEKPELALFPQLQEESCPDVHQPKVFYFFVALCL